MERRTVLVVEPDAAQRQLIDLLLSTDFDVTSVADGRAALAHLRAHTPDAMVVAIGLPDVDGYTLCRRARGVRRLRQVRTVLVANAGEGGTLDERARARGRAAGAHLVLPRPLGDKNLRERLERLIETDDEEAVVTPRALFNSGVLEAVAETPPTVPVASPAGGTPATELGGLRAEVARLREENDALRTRLEKSKELNRHLQEQLEQEKKRGRGLFGRRG